MMTFKFFTEHNVFTYTAQTLDSALEQFNKNHSSFSLIAVFNLQESCLVTNNVECAKANLNYQLF